jgi:predicted MFS family arabinose efflux permease
MTHETLRPKIILVALFFSFFVTQTPGILSGLLLVDISQDFNTEIGITAQMRSLSTGLGVLMALLMGAISMKYQHKTLLLIGLGLVAASAIGCCYSPTLAFLFLVYSLSGIGLAMVSPMANTLAAEHFHGDLRPLAIGMLIASASLSYVFGAPIISQLEQMFGWRHTFLSYILILNIVSIILIQFSVPLSENRSNPSHSFLTGFRSVLGNKSALACLFGVIISSASWQGLVFFSTSFYRTSYELPILLAAYMLSIFAIFFTSGSILSGRFTNIFGRKRLTIIGLLVMGSFTILFTYVPWFWVSFPIAIIGCFFGGVRYAASNNMSLEQIPEFRGTMMSLNSAALNLGQTIGSMVGGYILLAFNWKILGTVLGLFGITASIIFYVLTDEPLQVD